MKVVAQNCVTEWFYTTGKSYADPFNEVTFSAIVTDPDGQEKAVPGFWGGDNVWRIRYASPKLGIHTYRTICSDPSNDDLHGQTGEIKVIPYEGKNPLYKHGPIQESQNHKYLEHADGKPFFWLADTWWMGLTTRLTWPDGFRILTEDRKEKGFSVVQIVAGLYPDMDPFDERGANEAGFPWDPEFKSINPAYFDAADLKLTWLINSGIVPCIVGCWGFFLDFAGEEVIKKHWDYLLARYGAYPVVWCLAGEATMPYYLNKEATSSPEKRKEYVEWARKGWTDITRYLKEKDPFQRLITIHPTQYGHEQVEDESLLNLNMLQTGHGAYNSMNGTVKMIRTAVEREPRLPVINSEVCYEGICGTSYQDVQRFMFWSCMMNGACGHTYGANGIWQLNSIEKSYGPSPHGATWGNTPWEEAYKLPGSAQVGIGKKLFEKYDWWDFEAHPEWIEQRWAEDTYVRSYAAGIPGKVRVIFNPFLAGFGWGETLVKGIEKDATYRAYYYDPITGDEYDQGVVTPDEEGNWKSGKVSIFQDWVLVLEKVK